MYVQDQEMDKKLMCAQIGHIEGIYYDNENRDFR